MTTDVSPVNAGTILHQTHNAYKCNTDALNTIEVNALTVSHTINSKLENVYLKDARILMGINVRPAKITLSLTLNLEYVDLKIAKIGTTLHAKFAPKDII
jgi:hypothetical protein